MTYEVVDVIPDTDEWLQIRRETGIGASEVAAALGESHWGNTPFGLYLDKIGKGKPFSRRLSHITHALEPAVAAIVAEEQPDLGEISNGFMARSIEYPWLFCTFDRIITSPTGVRAPFQIKTASAFTRQDWNEGPVSDYLAQEDVECLILDAPYAYLAVLFTGSEEVQVYKLHARPERQQRILDRTHSLWYDHIVPRIPPAYTVGDDLEAIYPGITGQVVRADADTLDAVTALRETAAIRRAAVKEWNAVEGDMQFAIEKFMGDATELVNPYTNNLIHTWRPDKNGNRRHFSPKTDDYKDAA